MNEIIRVKISLLILSTLCFNTTMICAIVDCAISQPDDLLRLFIVSLVMGVISILVNMLIGLAEKKYKSDKKDKDIVE